MMLYLNSDRSNHQTDSPDLILQIQYALPPYSIHFPDIIHMTYMNFTDFGVCILAAEALPLNTKIRQKNYCLAAKDVLKLLIPFGLL
jgi:hypothetical protein